MSKTTKNIYMLYNNPFLLTPLIVDFYNGHQRQSRDILLSYLVFPLVLHENSRKNLLFAKSTSSIHSFRKKKENFYGLQDRISKYQDMTNTCLQYACSRGSIQINNDLSVQVIYRIKSEIFLNDFSKAAYNIKKIIKGQSVVSIYRLLGVKEI